MKKVLLGLLFVSASACGGDSGGGKDLFPPKPECMGDSVTPYAGMLPQVISSLQIGSVEDGFDLDGDGKPDNKLAAVSSLAASAITDSFKNYDIIIPLEFFDFPAVAEDTCVKFAIYLAQPWVADGDGDGKKWGIPDGDCNDNDPAIRPGATEILDNGKDDDCNGLADDMGATMPNTTDTMDRDMDGQTVADGDCDDTDATVKKGAAEICGDGKDNDCDGVADRSGDTPVCGPFDPAAPADLKIDPVSLEGGAPVIAFKDGTVDSSLNLVAGPSIFGVNIPVADNITLDLKITGATIKGQVAMDGSGAKILNGHLGGVIDSKTADTIRGLSVDQIGLTPENSLLDATFANLLGPLLALPKANADILKKYPNCRTPDIDVDGDGLEAFCDSDPNDDVKAVDVCIDGDGTEVHDEVDANGNVTKECTEATTKDGKPRFVDGISVELNFETTPANSLAP